MFSLSQKLLGWVGAGYGRVLAGSLRWRESPCVEAEAALASGPAILCCWHHHLFLAVRAVRRAHHPAALISRSRDGGAAAIGVASLGILPIRASRAKRGKANKGGLDGFALMAAHLQQGGVLALAPDGPRGPARQCSPGIAQLARFSGAPIICFGAAAPASILAQSWDRTRLPLLFTRAGLAWGQPIFIDRRADSAAVLACTQTVQAELNRLDATARALLEADR